MKKNIIKLTILYVILMTNSAFAVEKTARLDVQNMTCATCPITVKISLNRVEGVKNISFEDKVAVVVFDDDIADIDELIFATTNAGYPSNLIVK